MKNRKLANELIKTIKQLQSGISRNRKVENVREWLRSQTNEVGEPITSQDWMATVIELLTDTSIPVMFVAGAAQVGKTLTYLLATKYLAEQHKRIRIMILYPTRDQRDTYPYKQLVPILGEDNVRKKGHDLYYENGEFILRYANTSRVTKSTAGGSTARAGLTSFTADIGFREEASQGGDIDPIDRLNQSIFPAKPMRYHGTYGSGGGIEKLIEKTNAYKLEFEQECTCGVWNTYTTLLQYEIETNGRPYNLHFSNCPNCGATRNVGRWRLPADRTCINNKHAIYVSIHPFINAVTSEEYELKLKQLQIRCATEDSISNLWQQGLGMPFRNSLTRLSRSQLVRTVKPDSKVISRGIGYDHGRKSSYIAIVDRLENDRYHLSFCQPVAAVESVRILKNSECENTITTIDAYPDVLFSSQLAQQASHPAVLAVQKNTPAAGWDYKRIEIQNAGVTYPALGFQYVLWVEQLFSLVQDGQLTIDNSCSELVESHFCSVECKDGKVTRPLDHCDDLLFATVFALFALTLASSKPKTDTETPTYDWR